MSVDTGPLVRSLADSAEATLLCSLSTAGNPEHARVVWANALMVTTLADLDARPGAMAGRLLRSVLPPRGDTDLMAVAAAAVRKGESRSGVAMWRGSDGALARMYGYVLTPVQAAGEDSPVEHLVLRLRRVRDFQQAHEDPEASDALTGFLTRAAAMDRIDSAIADESATPFGVLLIDLTRLKSVNDALGESAGDAVLVIVGDRLQDAVGPRDTVARIGGDEFLVVLRDATTEADLVEAFRGIAEALSRPMQTNAVELEIGFVAGGVVASPGAATANELVARADLAMHRAKGTSGDRGLVVWGAAEPVPGRFVPGADPDSDGAAGRLMSVHELHRATREGELKLAYQPIFDIRTGRAAGCEALLRWDHPARGLLEPSDFLEFAGSNEEIHHIGAWTIREVARQLRDWGPDFPLDYYRVGVNISPRQLLDGDLVAATQAALAEFDVSSDRLVMELVESQELGSRAVSAEQIRDLVALGVRVAVDDFGSGFSNLSYLRDLPVDVIKVDRALVGLDPTARDEAILRAVVDVASAIGADVVLEGVERPKQLQLAVRTGVRFVQGYLVGKPALAGDSPPAPADPDALLRLAGVTELEAEWIAPAPRARAD